MDDPENGLVPSAENLQPIESFASLASVGIEKATRDKESKELNQSERDMLESIMSLTPDLIYFKDDRHRFQRVNKGYTDLLGLEEEEIIGKTAEDFWPKSDAIIEEEKRILAGEEVIGQERKAILPSGEIRWHIVNKLPRRDQEGNVIGILGIDRDITERKLTEKKLQKQEQEMSILMSNLPGMVYKCRNDKDWTMKFVSEGCRDLTGYEPEELIDNQLVAFGDLIFEEDKGKVRKKIQKQLDNQKSYQLEYRIRTKNGQQKWAWEKGRGVFNEDDKLQNLQGLITDITERKQTEGALDEERRKLKNLHDSLARLQKQNTEEKMAQTAVEVARSILDFKLCDVSLIEGKYLVPKASSTGVESDDSVSFEIGEGVTGKTIQKGETIWGDDIMDHPEAKPTNDNFKAFISVPIGDLGVFQVISEEVGSFSRRDVELVETLAGHLNEEVKRMRLEDKLKQQAIRDPLTDLYNRRYFNETLKKEVQQAKRYDKPIAFLMLDVNRFKEINDRYSHQTGDEVLCEVADLLEENVRGADTVIRYGGDEFLVMMPETNGGVINTVERLNEKLHRWNEGSDLLDFPLTLAMGVSHWRPDQERDVEEALKEADKKMYEDKRDKG